jgi:hypothetical protein
MTSAPSRTSALSKPLMVPRRPLSRASCEPPPRGFDGQTQVVNGGQQRRDDAGLLPLRALVGVAVKALAQLVRLPLELGAHLLEARCTSRACCSAACVRASSSST